MEKAIIFWLDGPPLCCKGVFDATARLWKGKSYYVCTKEINENRAKIASETGKSDGSAEYVMLSQMENPKESGTNRFKTMSSFFIMLNPIKTDTSIDE